MITRDQALTCNEFHAKCTRTVGPRGGVTVKQEVWRRNGKTQTWKTRPEDYRIPVKFGLYAYGEITQANAALVHAPEDCPLLAPVAPVPAPEGTQG